MQAATGAYNDPMNAIRILFALLILGAGAVGSAEGRDFCTKSSTPLVVDYPSGGSISLSYQVCISGSSHPSIYWDSSMTYDHVSFDGAYQINGTVDLQISWTRDSIGSVVFKNGPLIFTVAGKQHIVSFNNLSFNFDDSFHLNDTTGTLTIDGLTVPAESAYLKYLLR